MTKEKKCPLECPEWIQFLATETTLKRHDYYNENLSLLTKIITLLTLTNVFFVFISITANFVYVPSDIILIFTISGAIILIFVIVHSYRVFKKLEEKKNNTWTVR